MLQLVTVESDRTPLVSPKEGSAGGRLWKKAASARAEAALAARVAAHDAEIDAWFLAACATDPLRLAPGGLASPHPPRASYRRTEWSPGERKLI